MNLEELLKIESIKDKTHVEQINILGRLCNLSFDHNSLNGVEHYFKLSKDADYENYSPEYKVHFYFNTANAWQAKRKITHDQSLELWNFQLEELSKEIYYLRKAISVEGFGNCSIAQQCNVYCNLGNLFSYIGRFIEAIEYWDKAIQLDRTFAMALANKGCGLSFYQVYLYDEPHRELFFIFAYHYVKLGLKLKQFLHLGGEAFFAKLFRDLNSVVPDQSKDEIPELNNHDLGKNKKQKAYRQWCLVHRLYLNPINDLGAHTQAAEDCLNMPSMYFEMDAPPIYFTLFNQMKQEFGTARFMFYESIQRNKPHFSDEDILIMDTYESARYSYHLEQLKSSFRITYSILDKISYFLKHYLNLAIDDDRVGFRNVWYEKPKEKLLREFFRSSNNGALRGLYWLSKDLYDKDADFESVVEPEAKEIAKIRNAIEHKSFKILSEFTEYPKHLNKAKDIAYVINRQDFELKTLKLLTLTRAAMMYLVFAVVHEEKKRIKDRGDVKAIEIPAKTIPHEHKF